MPKQISFFLGFTTLASRKFVIISLDPPCFKILHQAFYVKGVRFFFLKTVNTFPSKLRHV